MQLLWVVDLQYCVISSSYSSYRCKRDSRSRETIGRRTRLRFFGKQLQFTPLLVMGKSLPHRIPGNNSMTLGAKQVSGIERRCQTNVLAARADNLKGRRRRRFIPFFSLLVGTPYNRSCRSRSIIPSSLSLRFLEHLWRRLLLPSHLVVPFRRVVLRLTALLFARDGTKRNICKRWWYG